VVEAFEAVAFGAVLGARPQRFELSERGHGFGAGRSLVFG
jgi:hypothetical protein